MFVVVRKVKKIIVIIFFIRFFFFIFLFGLQLLVYVKSFSIFKYVSHEPSYYKI